MAEIKQLIDAGTDLKVDEKSKPGKAKSASATTATAKPATNAASKAVTAKAKPKDKDASLSDWARDGNSSNAPVAPVVSKNKSMSKK